MDAGEMPRTMRCQRHSRATSIGRIPRPCLIHTWYDEMQRLEKLHRGTLTEANTVIANPTLQQGWHLDATGNWTNFTNVDQTNSANTLDQQRASNTANEITAINRTVGAPWATPAYDRNGNMNSVPQPAAMSSAYAATWDAWNRLVSLSSGLTTIQQNVYDGTTRRIQQIVSGVTRQYYYSDRWQSLEERLGASTTPDRQFVWGLRYIDDCVLRDRSVSGGTLNERLYALQDANWNVVAIVNTSGTVQERYAYTAYGVPLFLGANFSPLAGNTSAYAWETLYCGYRYDQATGIYRIRYRLLQPVVGCWLSRDPFMMRVDVNPQRYVRNRPLSRRDPAGLSDHHWLPQLNGKAQARYWNPLCCEKGIPVDIHDFTTTLPGSIGGGAADKVTTPHSAVEYKAGYSKLGQLIYDSATTCCQLLSWFTVLRNLTWSYLQDLNRMGVLSPKLPLNAEFEMHYFNKPGSGDTQRLWSHLNWEACKGKRDNNPPENLKIWFERFKERLRQLEGVPGPEPGIRTDPAFFALTVAGFGGIWYAVEGTATTGAAAAPAAAEGIRDTAPVVVKTLEEELEAVGS
jgi:RHS repeat-associated protein